MGNKKKRKDVVYSTNPDFNYESDNESLPETLPVNEQKLYVSIDRKSRKGKSVTLVEGFIGQSEDLKELSKTLKKSCGVGGTAKDDQIVVQGEFKDEIAKILIDMGYNTIKKGGR
jgi:translation initiation factor 1